MKSASRDEIVKFCSDYLSVKDFEDYCHNGLQVEGAAKVTKIVCGVSWSKKLVQHAIDTKAEMVLVHHGLFGDMLGKPPVIDGYMKGRLVQLLTHDISLVGFHLPLDAHPTIGNNASLCKLLGVKQLEKYDVGFVGNLTKAVTLEAFVADVNKKLNTDSIVIDGGKKQVKRVGIVSGGAARWVYGAAKMGVDTFLCGEPSEDTVRSTEELGVSLIAAGHYNTEKLGVTNLGKLVAKEFGIKAEFFDVPCEI